MRKIDNLISMLYFGARMFPLRFSLFIVALFLVNMILRELNLEPYPTLLLPDGPANITKDENDRITIDATELYALDNHNRWSKVDLNELAPKMMNPATNLAKINFGLNPPVSKTERIKSILHLKGGQEKTASVKKFNIWLSDKLSARGFQTDSLKILSVVSTVSLKSKETVERKITYEEAFKLR